MSLVVIDRDDERIEAITFEDLDLDNDMGICIDFLDKTKESLTVYLKRSQVEALKRHVDTEINRLKH